MRGVVVLGHLLPEGIARLVDVKQIDRHVLGERWREAKGQGESRAGKRFHEHRCTSLQSRDAAAPGIFS